MVLEITDDEFLRIYRLMKNRYGIDLGRKREIIRGRLDNYIQANGFGSYHEYMNVVERDITGGWERELVNILTTNHTFFMREFEHFEYMRSVALPQLKKKEEARKDLCIWCGAASTGQEPYTLAMLLKDFFGLEHDLWDTTVLATDISTEVLEQAENGIYTAEQIAELPENWRRRYLRPVGAEGNFEITPDIKAGVLFRRLNLMDPFPFKRKMHIVFLRNVMIYFDKETKNKIVQKVYDVMEPGGYLFVGQTETIDRNVVPFKLIRPSIFQK